MADLFIVRERLKFSLKLTLAAIGLGAFATWYFWSHLELGSDRSRFLMSAVVTGGLILAFLGLLLFYSATKKIVEPSRNLTDGIDSVPWWIIKVVMLILCIAALGLFMVRFSSRGETEFDLLRKGNLSQLKQRVEADPGILSHLDQRGGITLIQMAYREGLADAVSLLVGLGASVEGLDEQGRNPVVASLENPPMLEALLNSGFDPGLPDAAGVPPLHNAVMQQSREAITILLNAGAKIDVRDKLFRTPLQVAVERDDHDMMKFLLENGASPDAYDRRGDTALHKAARRRNAESIRILLDHGADPRIFNFAQMTPLHLVAIDGQKELVAQFLELPDMIGLHAENGPTPLDQALKNRKYETADLLIAKAADINRIQSNGDTLLHQAILQRDYRTARYLIRAGADVYIENSTGETAHDIMRRKQLSGLLDLVEARDNPDASTNTVESAETVTP